jgi:Zn-dependent protease
MFLSPREVIDLIIMTAGVGFIFMDLFGGHQFHNPLRRFDWRAFRASCLVTAPAVIFHELAHKFVAIAFGVDATFHAAYLFLLIGVILKIIRSPIIFFVPGYVSIPLTLAPAATSIAAFAGPALNGILYLIAVFVTENTRMQHSGRTFWLATRRLNGFLFIFNMLPIPGLDGFTAFSSLFHAFPF